MRYLHGFVYGRHLPDFRRQSASGTLGAYESPCPPGRRRIEPKLRNYDIGKRRSSHSWRGILHLHVLFTRV